jgi:hypothetical protein
MKKLLLTAFIAVSISISSFAQGINEVDKNAIDNFEATFTGASNVEWTSTKNFTIASFMQDDRKVEVFYDPAGEFVATTRQIDIEDAPAYSRKIITRKYIDYVVKEAFEFRADNELHYFISIENDKENIVLKVKEGSVSIFSQTEKS